MEVVLFTENGKGGRGFLTNSLVTDFQNEYPPIRIKPNPDCHDRLIVLDYGEEDRDGYIIVEHPVRMQGRNFVPSIRLQRQQSFIR